MKPIDWINDHPIPGESLTSDPNKRLPFERPPEHTDFFKAKDYLWEKLSSQRGIKELYRLLRKDVPVSDIAQVLVFAGFSEGKWNYNLLLQLIEPVVFMIMWLAYKGNVDFIYSRDIPSLNALMEERKNPRIKREFKGDTPMGLMSPEEEVEEPMPMPEGMM